MTIALLHATRWSHVGRTPHSHSSATVVHKAGYRTERKNVPHSRRLKKTDLWIKDFQLAVVQNVIVDVTLCHEYNGSCANPIHNGEPSHPDVNGELDATVKEKLDNY